MTPDQHTELPLPEVTSRAEWEEARAVLLQQEKALTRMKDAVAAQRRRLPVVEVDGDYRFAGSEGPVTLLELFQGRDQLIIQHFMFGPDWNEGCDGCSMMAERLGPLSHLHARRTSFALVSAAPVEKLQRFQQRMGWQLPWVSSAGSSFNEDFGATVEGQEQQAISVFLRHRDRVYHSWSTFARGEEPFMVIFELLDLTPYGRQESWEHSPPGWPQEPTYSWMRLKDQYDEPTVGSCPGH